MNTLTRQDVQAIVDLAKNRILDRVVTKTDMQTFSEGFRMRILTDLRDMGIDNQQLLRQHNVQGEQFWRRMQTIETRLITLEHEIKQMQQMFMRALDQQSRTTQLTGLNVLSAFKRA